jgi:hypothetical protein
LAKKDYDNVEGSRALQNQEDVLMVSYSTVYRPDPHPHFAAGDRVQHVTSRRLYVIAEVLPRTTKKSPWFYNCKPVSGPGAETDLPKRGYRNVYRLAEYTIVKF